VVQDSSKAAITDARLRLINTDTGAENDSVTNAEGGFRLPGIIPGNYTLQIESAGFATTQVNGITLTAGDTKGLLIRMKVGPVTETVNVDASGLILNRTNASVTTLVDRRLIASIPLNGRSLQDLILVAPGIVTQNPQTATQSGTQTQGDFSVNGQPTDTNSYFVDGAAGIAHAEHMFAPVSVRTLYIAPGLAKTLPRECRTLNISSLLRELILHASRQGALDPRTPVGQGWLRYRVGWFAVQVLTPAVPTINTARGSLKQVIIGVAVQSGLRVSGGSLSDVPLFIGVPSDDGFS